MSGNELGEGRHHPPEERSSHPKSLSLRSVPKCLTVARGYTFRLVNFQYSVMLSPAVHPLTEEFVLHGIFGEVNFDGQRHKIQESKIQPGYSNCDHQDQAPSKDEPVEEFRLLNPLFVLLHWDA